MPVIVGLVLALLLSPLTLLAAQKAAPKGRAAAKAKKSSPQAVPTQKPAVVTQKKDPDLWSLKPVVRPEAPAGVTESSNPIDAFIAAGWKEKGLRPAGPADKRTLLRRVYLDL